jgi:hypothetical protein
MDQHISLCIALLLIVVLEYYTTRARYHRNWCGIRLAFPILVQAVIPMALVTLIYFDIYHTGSVEINPRYFCLLSFLAATGAHFFLHWVTRLQFVERSGTIADFSIVPSRIAQKRLQLAHQLRSRADWKDLLYTAIDLADIPTHIKASLRRAIAKCSYADEHIILQVIDEAGVTVIKVVMKGAQ